MDRVNYILQNNSYKEYVKLNEEYEKDRIFCHHDMQHFLDVARIAYIQCLERNLNIEKDVIYATALLHDIGRWKEYKYGISHELAGVELAKDILEECEYSEEEKAMILEAIGSHRKKDNLTGSLNEIIYISDKLSRNCFNCKGEELCTWSREKKNLNIKY